MNGVEIKFPVMEEMNRGINSVAEQVAQLNKSIKELIFVLTPPDASRIIFFVEEGGQLKRVGGNMFQKVTESKRFAIKITDRFGNDARVDGVPAWASSDESLVGIVVAEDGLSAVVTPVGPLGSLKLQVKADADLGEGVRDLLGELDLDLVAGDAEVIAISEVPAEAPAEEAPVEEAPVQE